jgi:uncharacterized protein (TIGR03437 family)
LWAVFLLLSVRLSNADTFLIKSTDAGRTWLDIDPGPPHQLLDWLGTDPRTSNLYVITRRDSGSEGQLSVSSDGGRTWEVRQTFPAETSWTIRAAGPGVSDTLYVAYRQPGTDRPKSIVIAKLTKGGTAIEQYPAKGLLLEGFAFLESLTVDEADPSRLYAVTRKYADNDILGDGDLFFQAAWRSVDGGRHWSRLEIPVNVTETWRYSSGFHIGPSGSPLYFLCGDGLLKSVDGGDSWIQKLGPGGERVDSLQVDPAEPDTLYTFPQREIWKSADAGESWQYFAKLPNYAFVYPVNASAIYTSGASGILKSEDRGETWSTVLAADAPSLPRLLRLNVDPRWPGTLYAFGSERLEVRLHDRQTYLRNLLGEKQVAPGGLVTIYGADLARETQAASSTPLPLTLAGASVTFNGQPAALLFVSPGQINAQLPFGLASQIGTYPPTASVLMEVHRADGSVDRQTVSVSPQAVVILRENLTRQSAPRLLHASDLRPVTADDPARRGETIILYALGMGELQPSMTAGAPAATPAPQLPNSPCVVFSERPNMAPLSSKVALEAGAAPGLIGVYQVNLEVPASLNPGSYTLSLNSHSLSNPYDRACLTGYQGNILDFVTIEVR